MKFIDLFKSLKYRYEDNSANGIIWFINIVPSISGFSILDDSRKKITPFWIAHYALVFYAYFYGGVVSSLKIAEEVGAVIKGLVTIFIIILIVNAGYWFLTTRSLLKSVLDKVIRIDSMSRRTDFLLEKYKKLLIIVKKTVFVYYTVNAVDTFIIYIPERLGLSSEIYTANPCTGIKLTTTVNRYICRSIILAQDITVAIVVFNFQALLLFLIGHTAAMYILLSEEMISLNDYDGSDVNRVQIQEKLCLIIERHALILEIVEHLKYLYNMALGVHFASNAVCLSLFFCLSLRQWITYIPVLVYCFVVFFLYCYLCQKLVNASVDFEHAVYNCGWEKFGVDEKKTVYIMLKIAQRPVRLLAADMVPVNMYTFATTLQAMYKFITVVKI